MCVCFVISTKVGLDSTLPPFFFPVNIQSYSRSYCRSNFRIYNPKVLWLCTVKKRQSGWGEGLRRTNHLSKKKGKKKNKVNTQSYWQLFLFFFFVFGVSRLGYNTIKKKTIRRKTNTASVPHDEERGGIRQARATSPDPGRFFIYFSFFQNNLHAKKKKKPRLICEWSIIRCSPDGVEMSDVYITFTSSDAEPNPVWSQSCVSPDEV